MSFFDLTCRRVLLHNLRYDEPVAEFANASGVGAAAAASGKAGGAPHGAGGGACSAISFRTGARKSTYIRISGTWM